MLIFSFDYPPNTGGIARLNAAIAAALDAKHIPVRVLTQEYLLDSPPAIDAQVETLRLTSHRPWRELQAFQKLAAQRRHELGLSGIWYPEGLIMRAVGISPLVILAYGSELYPPPQRWRQSIWSHLRRFVLEYADLVIADSHFTAHLVEQLVPKAQVTALPLAVDHDHFRPQDRVSARSKWQIADGQRVLCSVSRLHRFKGHETVFEAIARLSPPIRETFVYLVAGKGPDLAYLQSRAAQLGVEANVRWLGFVTDEDLPSLYAASDLFVLMTRELPEEQAVEGFGLVFLEAQACGTPVVGTNTGGIPDAISPEDGGWLVDQDDVDELAGILRKLADEPEVFRAMGEKARQRVERSFTWSHYADRLLEALESKGISFDQ